MLKLREHQRQHLLKRLLAQPTKISLTDQYDKFQIHKEGQDEETIVIKSQYTAEIQKQSEKKKTKKDEFLPGELPNKRQKLNSPRRSISEESKKPELAISNDQRSQIQGAPKNEEEDLDEDMEQKKKPLIGSDDEEEMNGDDEEFANDYYDEGRDDYGGEQADDDEGAGYGSD